MSNLRNAEVHKDYTGLGSAAQKLRRPLENDTVTNKACSDVPQSPRNVMATTDADPGTGFYDKGYSHGQIHTMSRGSSCFSSIDVTNP